MIRRLTEKDINTVSQIWLDTNIKTHSFIPTQYWEQNFKAVKEMMMKAEMYVYTNDNGDILGFIGLSGNYIDGIFVRAENQSCGIGKKLIDFVKKIKSALELNVYCKNESAVRFYKNHGFIIKSEETDENTGEKEYLMIWRG